MTLEDSYHEISRFSDNLAYIETNAEAIHTAIDTGLQDETTEASAADLLLMIFPRLMVSCHVKRWVRLIERAVRNLVESPMVSYPETRCPEYVIEGQYILRRLDHSLTVRPMKTRRRRTRINPRQMYENYLLLTLTLFFQGKLMLDHARIKDMLAFARMINHPQLYNKLYQVMGVIYNQQGDYERARLHAEMSFRYFDRQDDMLESAQSAHAIAMALRGQSQTGKADEWEKLAKERIKETCYAKLFDSRAG